MVGGQSESLRAPFIIIQQTEVYPNTMDSFSPSSLFFILISCLSLQYTYIYVHIDIYLPFWIFYIISLPSSQLSLCPVSKYLPLSTYLPYTMRVSLFINPPQSPLSYLICSILLSLALLSLSLSYLSLSPPPPSSSWIFYHCYNTCMVYLYCNNLVMLIILMGQIIVSGTNN